MIWGHHYFRKHPYRELRLPPLPGTYHTYHTSLVLVSQQVTFILFALSVGSLKKSWRVAVGFFNLPTVGPGSHGDVFVWLPIRYD